MSPLRRIPFANVLYRPNLLLGGERKLVILTGILAIGITLSDISVFKILFSLGFWGLCLALLRFMAKIDPQLSRIYLRRLRYHAFYSAQSRALR